MPLCDVRQSAQPSLLQRRAAMYLVWSTNKLEEFATSQGYFHRELKRCRVKIGHAGSLLSGASIYHTTTHAERESQQSTTKRPASLTGLRSSPCGALTTNGASYSAKRYVFPGTVYFLKKIKQAIYLSFFG